MVLVVEHGSSPSGRWLRKYRGRLALWIAVAEGLLVLLGVIPRWPALLVAAGLLLFYVLVGRNLSSDKLREVSWIAAVSQLFIALLPVLVALLTFAAIFALAVLAVVALGLLWFDRR